jgi:glutathione S-transferase
MLLHLVAGSNNSRKVQAVIGHLGLAVDYEYLDFFAGEHKSPDYLQLNPNGMVPTLTDGDFVLWESNAICRYLCSKVAQTSLYPADRRQQADIERWMSWELAHFNSAMGVLAFEAVAKPVFMQQQPNAEIVAWSSDALARFTTVLEKHLQGRETLVGDGITLADYAVVHIEQFKEALPFDWAPFPAVNAYFDRMRKVPYWSATAVAPEQMGHKPR